MAIYNEQKQRTAKDADGNVVITQTVASEPDSQNSLSDINFSLLDWNVKPYAGPDGRKLVSNMDVTVNTSVRTGTDKKFFDLEFTFDTSTAETGSQYFVDFTVTDGAVDGFESEFLYENGIPEPAAKPDLARFSAQKYSEQGTYADSDLIDTSLANLNTNVADWDVTSGSLTFLDSSSTASRYSDDTIPLLDVGDQNVTLEGPPNLFNGRRGSILMTLSWDFGFGSDFDVVDVRQGSNSYFKVQHSNSNNNFSLQSDFTNSRLATLMSYNSLPGDRLSLAFRIDEEFAQGEINRKSMDGGPRGLNNLSFEQGNTTVNFNPSGSNVGLELHDLYLYREPLSFGDVNTFAKYSSSIYGVELDVKGGTHNNGAGSPYILDGHFRDKDVTEIDLVTVVQRERFGRGDVNTFDKDLNSIKRFGLGYSTPQTSSIDPWFNLYTDRKAVLDQNRRFSEVNNDPLMTSAPRAVVASTDLEIYEAPNSRVLYKRSQDSRMLWKTDLDTKVRGGGSTMQLGMNEDFLFFVDGQADGYKVDATDGTILWSTENNSYRSVDVDSSGASYFGTSNSEVAKYDGSGTQLWSFQFNNGSDVVYGLKVDTNGAIYVGTRGGEVAKIEENSGTPSLVWESTVSGTIRSLEISNEDYLYVGDRNDRVYKLSKSDGSVLSYSDVNGSGDTFVNYTGGHKRFW